jgi:MFS family permease
VSPLLRFTLVLAAGVLGAANIGKLVPHVAWLADQFAVPLGLSGFAISAVMLPGAVLSVGLGVLTDRLDAKIVTISGLLIGAAASTALPLAEQFWQLILLRLVEGVGYCVVVVAATVLVVEVSGARHRVLALAVWSSFAPVGFALGQWASAAVQGDDRLGVIGLWHGALLAAAALVLMLALPRHLPITLPIGRKVWLEGFRHPPTLLAALAFGCVVGILLAAVAVTPLVLARTNAIPVADAARLTALAALSGIAGRFASGWLLGTRLTPGSVLLAAAFAGTAALGASLLVPMPLGLALLLFALFQIFTGIIPGVLSAMIPHVAPSPDQLGTVSGLVNQMVNVGNLIGPPLVLSLYAAADAWAAFVALAVWSALCVGLVVRLAVFRRSLA